MFLNKKQSDVKIDSQIFVYYDSKSKSYGQPMFATNEHAIIRDISNMFRNPEEQQKSILFLNAEDFSLFRIGSYDKSTGTITPQNPEHVANLHELRAIIPTTAQNFDAPRALSST